MDRAEWRPVATHEKVLSLLKRNGLFDIRFLHARCHNDGQGKMQARGNPCKKYCPCSKKSVFSTSGSCMQGATAVDRAKWRPVATHAKDVHAGCHSDGQGKMEVRGNPCKKCCPCSQNGLFGIRFLHAGCHSDGQGRMEARGNPCSEHHEAVDVACTAGNIVFSRTGCSCRGPQAKH